MSSSSLSALRVVSSASLRGLIFLPAGEPESKLREVGLAGAMEEAAFCLTCRLTVLSSSASQPFTHQLPQGGGWERRVRREQREVRSGPLEGTGARIDLITIMPV